MLRMKTSAGVKREILSLNTLILTLKKSDTQSSFNKRQKLGKVY